jgi:hypothetical protein
MSLDATVLAELKRQSEEWNRKNITAPRYGQNGGEKSPFEFIGELIGKLTKRVAELENRPQLRYLGVFREGRSYEPGAFVTYSGAIWHCNQSTTIPPGNGAAAWTLAVKSGQSR